MATISPSFREILPAWLFRQPWYVGPIDASVSPVGFVRVEDPDGRVGVEAHLLMADGAVYNVPLTYRDAPLPGGDLVVQAEHSELGTRWIYDATTDPVWSVAVLHALGCPGKVETVRVLAEGDVSRALPGSWRPDGPQGRTLTGPIAFVRP